jgi:hypothetical protein
LRACKQFFEKVYFFDLKIASMQLYWDSGGCKEGGRIFLPGLIAWVQSDIEISKKDVKNGY